ncbi:DUF3135 domain-containing protein [Vibrio mytili]|uniref:DUF3135 domain-containing protein n=1 Tax=Vibrio mytili TaxID=50718 RepID=UPI003C704011
MANPQQSLQQSLPSFDEMVRMAERDPVAFEQFRHDMAEAMINNASAKMQPRLRAQQSHIDRMIDHCKNPNHTNVVLGNELRKQFVKFQQALQGKPQANKPDNVVQFY